jgi:beta-lactamase class C
VEFEVMDMIYHLPFRDWLELNMPVHPDTQSIAQNDTDVENGEPGR